MREILFKAKATDNGEWVEGSLINAFEYTCILQAEDKLHPTDYPYLDGNIGTFDGKATPIIPETVGQFTGLTDKNGKKIFEGDVIANSCGRKETVEFYKGRYYPFIAFPEYNCWDEKECEVIGTIHDNPELIGGEPE